MAAVPAVHAFRAVIQGHDSGGAFVVVPFDVETAFGAKRPPVLAHLDGVAYRGTLVRRRGLGVDGAHLLLVRKDVQAAMGKGPGDTVEVTMARDDAPRTVTPPEDFAGALAAHPAAAAFFDGLAFTHRREVVQWIEEARKAETREQRIAQAVARLAEGRTSR